MSDKQFCKYHPKSFASWNCFNCHIQFCSSCVPLSNESRHPNCTLCNKALSSLSVADQIPPLWNKLVSFFYLPINQLSLVIILFYSLSSLLIPAGKLAIIITLLVAFPLVKYCFELLEQMANAENLNRSLKRFLVSENKGFFTRLIVTYGVIWFSLFKLKLMLGTVIFMPIAILLVFSFPASMIILSIEKQFISMVNPHKIYRTIIVVGGDYFILSLLSTANFYFILQVNVIFDNVVSNQFLLFLANVLSAYLWIVLFSMMGYLILRHHVEFNYRIDRVGVFGNKNNSFDRLTEVDIFLQEGRYEDAQSTLLKLIKAAPLDSRAYEKLILLYAFQENSAHLKKMADEYFDKLVAADKIKHAADFYCNLHSKYIDYKLPNPELALSMTKTMNNKTQYQNALSIIDGFSSAPNANSCWEKFALLEAKILAEFDDNLERAVIVLNLIVKHSFNQEILLEAESYLELLSKAKKK